MKTLFEALKSSPNEKSGAVIKHLEAFGIHDWEDCTKVNLSDFVDYLTDKVCQSSAHTYTAIFRAVLNKYTESGVIPCADIKEALRCKNEKSQKIYLTEKELSDLEKVVPRNEYEMFTKLCFLISSKTGMRISDTLRVSKENISNGVLTYVSQKTSIQASIPVSEKVQGWIERVNDIEKRPNQSNFELIIKRLCKRAGIEEKKKVFRAGQESVKYKWELVTSHTARVSFCTLLSQKGVELVDICSLAGHTNPTMTSNYIVRTAPKLNDKQMEFFK